MQVKLSQKKPDSKFSKIKQYTHIYNLNILDLPKEMSDILLWIIKGFQSYICSNWKAFLFFYCLKVFTVSEALHIYWREAMSLPEAEVAQIQDMARSSAQLSLFTMRELTHSSVAGRCFDSWGEMILEWAGDPSCPAYSPTCPSGCRKEREGGRERGRDRVCVVTEPEQLSLRKLLLKTQSQTWTGLCESHTAAEAAPGKARKTLNLHLVYFHLCDIVRTYC